jgi:hypothetical protein
MRLVSYLLEEAEVITAQNEAAYISVYLGGPLALVLIRQVHQSYVYYVHVTFTIGKVPPTYLLEYLVCSIYLPTFTSISISKH